MALIRIKKPWEIPESHTTGEHRYLNRRKFLQALGIGSIGGMSLTRDFLQAGAFGPFDQSNIEYSQYDETLRDQISNFNNFAEFSHWNAEVPDLTRSLDTDSWPITITGLVKKPLTLEASELLRLMDMEERSYRFRCIEGWSMVLPWSGFPLNKLLKLVQPESNARYVRFDSFHNPDVAPSQQVNDWYTWPYTEALTLEEAKNELTFIASGLFGKDLPKAQGAPLRLIVPWKYATKSIKSITRIEFTSKRPGTFWEAANPGVCDFHCNVNPTDTHANVPQAEEILINTGDWQTTLPYNGYAEWVSGLYT